MEGCQHQFIVHFVYCQGFFVEASNEGPQALMFSLFYNQQAGRGVFVPLPSNKVVEEQITQLLERTNRRYFTEP